MTADLIAILFTAFNSLRVLAYVPQIICVARDQNGASAISYTTWSLFALSHLSTVAYAMAVVNDWRMAIVFASNAGCCAVIVALAIVQRTRHRRRAIL